MGIDITLLQASKGGDLEAVKLSQARRFASTDLVDDTLAKYTYWTQGNLFLPLIEPTFFLFLETDLILLVHEE